MIEYLATAAAVGFVWAGIEWRERRGATLAVMAVAFDPALEVVNMDEPCPTAAMRFQFARIQGAKYRGLG